MPAYFQRDTKILPGERLRGLCAAVLIELAVGFVLLRGLAVEFKQPADTVQRLISVTLVRTMKPTVEPTPIKARSVPQSQSAPQQSQRKAGASVGPKPRPAPTSIAPVVAVQTSTAPTSGGGRFGSGAGTGSGSGGGKGGSGAGDGGTDLEQIAGEITPRDYPRHLGNAGIGGRVGVLFTVGVTGRVTSCAVTRSSGVPELDALTCRLIQERFRYRPSTDSYGRPIPDQVEGEHDWTAGG